MLDPSSQREAAPVKVTAPAAIATLESRRRECFTVVMKRVVAQPRALDPSARAEVRSSLPGAHLLQRTGGDERTGLQSGQMLWRSCGLDRGAVEGKRPMSDDAHEPLLPRGAERAPSPLGRGRGEWEGRPPRTRSQTGERAVQPEVTQANRSTTPATAITSGAPELARRVAGRPATSSRSCQSKWLVGWRAAPPPPRSPSPHACAWQGGPEREAAPLGALGFRSARPPAPTASSPAG
jgi:hypothetical protein